MGVFDILIGLLLLPAAIADTILQRPVNFQSEQATINGRDFELYVADTPEKLQYGFKGREVAENEAMLFIFPAKATRAFWMRGTKTPLDIVFLDENYTITKVIENAQPCSIFCRPHVGTGKYVLEFRAGAIDFSEFEIVT